MTGRIRPVGLVTLATAALALGLAACGSSNSSSSTPASTAASGSGGAAASSSTSTAASGSSSGGNFKVGLVTDIGGLNDHGFNHLSYQGLLQAEKQLGVKGTVLQSQSGADYVPNLTRLAQAGNKLVIAVGFLMAAPLQQVATKYPNTHFAIIDSPGGTAPDTAKNIEGIDFAEQQAGYPAGYLTGLYLKEKGYSTASTVGGQSIPPVNLYIAGFQAGVKAADPSAKLLNAYSQDFVAQDKCKELALNQIQAGSKVVFQVAGACGLGAISAAVQNKDQAIGVDADQSYLSPTYVLTSAEKKVDVGVFTAIKNLMSGQFSANLQEDITNGGVGIGKIGPAGAKYQSQINDIIAKMKSGQIKPPTTLLVTK
ncbi:MAG TPA: BMP family ABC transporter substrate-binding protein [Solirubrobacteraceae bacterium]|nr:BMP family ABC transporter substrate-binding protein [Solirubrobacteraceae bacterium]